MTTIAGHLYPSEDGDVSWRLGLENGKQRLAKT